MITRVRYGLHTTLLTIAVTAMCAFPAFAAETEAATGPAAEISATAGTSAKTISHSPSAEPSESGTRGSYLGKFDTTAYCNCESCCSGGFALTYSGTVPTANHTISADITRFPIGTRLMIGDTIYTVEDIGSGVSSNLLDIYFDTHQEALNYGKQTVDVYAVE